MPALAITGTYPLYTDKLGRPLEGKVYFGLPNQNPITAPKQVYWDKELTQPAAQPLSVSGGYIVRAGTPARLFSDGDYSSLVQTKNNETVFYITNNQDADSGGTLGADLANALDDAKGDALVAVKQPFVGSVARTQHQKNTDFISVMDFGAKGDGVTDDTVAINAAMLSLGTKGGVVTYNQRHLVNGNLIIPSNVTLKGPMSLVGSPKDNTSAPYDLMSGIILNAAATITLKGGAGVDGCLIYRKGCQFPSPDAANFAGTAITISGDDAFVINSQILGFNQGIYSSGFQRGRFSKIWFDCNNGIYIGSCFDIAYINNCHGWPFVTISAIGPASSLRRSGTAFKFENGGDWNKIDGCFSYGYYRSVWVNNCNSMTISNCGADSTGSYAGQIAFYIEGNSEDTRLSFCQAAAQETGYYVSTASGVQTRFSFCDSWACSANGVVIAAGDIHIIGGIHRQTASGIAITSSGTRGWIDYVRFKSITSLPINLTINTADLHIGENNDYTDFAAGNSVVDATKKLPYSIPSADPLNIPSSHNFIKVTGVNNFGTINGGWAGREITLFFDNTLLISDGGTSLKLAASFTTNVNSTLTLVHNGVAWVEKSRSLNGA